MDYSVQLWNAIEASKRTLKFEGHIWILDVDMHSGAISWIRNHDAFYATPNWEDIEGISIEKYGDEGECSHEILPFKLTNDLKADVHNYFKVMQEYLDNHVGWV